MVALKIPVFAGMVPSIDPHLLSDQNAAFARDTWLYSGALEGIPEKVELHTLLNPAATVAFRIPLNDGDPTYLYASRWMEFENANTDFIQAPVSGDQFRRFYWASSSQVPSYNTLARIIAGQPPFLLGIQQPADNTVVASGGSSTTNVSRAYLTTMVSEYGEEGPASDPFLINGKIDDTFAVTVPGVDAGDLGTVRNIKKIRIYRTITSSAGTATYYQVAELDALTTTQVYNDTMTDAVLSSKPILESTAWTAPPDLEGMMVMPNGIVAGFEGKNLYFSEAYRPHAWPAAYGISLEHNIIGFGIIGQTLVVCTDGNPYTASGVNPASITTSKIAAFEPCLSKGSILSTEEGVYYTSPTGLILVNSGYAQNITKQFISREGWNAIVNRAKVNAGRVGSAYYAYGTGVQRAVQSDAFQNNAFQVETSAGSTDGFLLDPTNTNVGFVVLGETSDIKSLKNDQFSGELLIVKDGKVWWLNQNPGYIKEPYVWRSKIFQTPFLKNFAAYKIYFYDPADTTFTQPQNFNINQIFNPATQYGVIRVFADNVLVSAQEIRVPGELHRLPSGFKASFWQIEIEARVKVKSFQMATSVKELQVV
jgi:hypothetical protein